MGQSRNGSDGEDRTGTGSTARGEAEVGMSLTSRPAPEVSNAAHIWGADVLRQRRELSLVIHRMLTLGLGVSVAAMIIGISLDVGVHREFSATVPAFRDVVPEILSLRPPGLFALGLLTLIATPVLRVVGSFFTFLRERDFQFAGITFLVLVILFFSLVLGRG